MPRGRARRSAKLLVSAHEVYLEPRRRLRERVEPCAARPSASNRHPSLPSSCERTSLDLLGRNARVDVVTSSFRGSPRTAGLGSQARLSCGLRLARPYSRNTGAPSNQSVSSGWKVATRTLPFRAMAGSSTVTPPASRRRPDPSMRAGPVRRISTARRGRRGVALPCARTTRSVVLTISLRLHVR